MKEKLEELKAKVAKIQKEIEKLEKEESKYLDLSVNDGWKLGDKWQWCELPSDYICVRRFSEFKSKGFYLSGDFRWEIIKDSSNALVLLPTKK